jgi:predicted transposase YbfD/YdcC
MPASPSSLISALSCAPAGALLPDTAGLPAALAHVPDPRARRGVRHRLPVVVSAAVCAVVAGYRSYTAIAEWIDDVPATTALTLGIDPDRRPSETMIRRLLQALDPDLLTAAIGVWLAARAATAPPTPKRAIAVDGKTLRGSRTTDTTARHVMTACDQDTGIVLASTDVAGHTNEITRFGPLLDQIGDLRDTVITVDALHCQRDHVCYLNERGADWIMTVKGNQPTLHQQLAGLPWRAVPDATRDTDRGHGRREIRTLKILTVSTGIGFPHAAQALQIRRRRHRLDQPKRFTTETVYAITNLRVHEARPAQLAAWIRRHWHIENRLHWVRDVTYDEDRSQIRTGAGPQVMAALRNAAIGALRAAGVTNIAAANRHHARDANRPLELLGIT